MRSYFLFFLLAFTLLFGDACTEHCGNRDILLIPQEVIDAVPYDDKEILQYVTSNGNVITTTMKRSLSTIIPDAPLICEDVLELSTAPLFLDILVRSSIEPRMIQISLPNNTDFTGGPLQFFVNDDGSFSKPTYSTAELTKHTSISLKDKVFNNVLQLHFPKLEEKTIKDFYYNKDFGVIGIEAYNGFTLYRKF